MKKLALSLALIMAVAAFAGCSSAPSSSAPSSAPSSSAPASEPASEPSSEPSSAPSSEAAGEAEPGSLEALMDQVLAAGDAEQMPMLMPAELNDGAKYTSLTDQNSEYCLGVTRDRYAEGIAAEAAMTSVPFSVCLVKANSAEEAEQLAADIEANADPRKWICVEAESKIVDYSGDTVILIMTGADLAEQLHSGFTAAVAE